MESFIHQDLDEGDVFLEKLKKIGPNEFLSRVLLLLEGPVKETMSHQQFYNYRCLTSLMGIENTPDSLQNYCSRIHSNAFCTNCTKVYHTFAKKKQRENFALISTNHWIKMTRKQLTRSHYTKREQKRRLDKGSEAIKKHNARLRLFDHSKPTLKFDISNVSMSLLCQLDIAVGVAVGPNAYKAEQKRKEILALLTKSTIKALGLQIMSNKRTADCAFNRVWCDSQYNEPNRYSFKTDNLQKIFNITLDFSDEENE